MPVRPVAVEHQIDERPKPVKPVPPKRRFLRNASDLPPKVLTWHKAADRATKLRHWRLAVGRDFADSSRILRVAWTLEYLFNPRTGYAHATDSFLARELDPLPRNKIQSALTELERAGAIIRRSVYVKGGKQRRI